MVMVHSGNLAIPIIGYIFSISTLKFFLGQTLVDLNIRWLDKVLQPSDCLLGWLAILNVKLIKPQVRGVGSRDMDAGDTGIRRYCCRCACDVVSCKYVPTHSWWLCMCWIIHLLIIDRWWSNDLSNKHFCKMTQFFLSKYVIPHFLP